MLSFGELLADLDLMIVPNVDPGAKVCPGVFIGSLNTANNEECLANNRITAIINLSGRRYHSHLPVFEITMDDAEVTPQNIADYSRKFGAGVEAMIAARTRGHILLVHCMAGINRSATLICFYLLHHGYSYEEALVLLTEANLARGTSLLTNCSFRHMLQAGQIHC